MENAPKKDRRAESAIRSIEDRERQLEHSTDRRAGALLRLPIRDTVSKELADAIEKHNSMVTKFDAERLEYIDAVARVAAPDDSATGDEVLAAASALPVRRYDLARRRLELFRQRNTLLDQLVELVSREVAEAEGVLERARRHVTEKFERAGISAQTLRNPVNGVLVHPVNPVAARAIFESRVNENPTVIEASQACEGVKSEHARLGELLRRAASDEAVLREDLHRALQNVIRDIEP